MPGCWVPNCTNSHAKDYIMITFPKDPIVRRTWIEYINRKDAVPSSHCCICEVHFPDYMWDKNCPVKLKDDAVPVVFNSNLPAKRRAMIKPGINLRNLRFKKTKRIKLENGNSIDINMKNIIAKKPAKIRVKTEQLVENPIKRCVGRPKKGSVGPIKPTSCSKIEYVDVDSSSVPEIDVNLNDFIDIKEENPFLNRESITLPNNILKRKDDGNWREKFNKLYKLWENCERSCVIMKNQLAEVKTEIKQLQLKVDNKVDYNNFQSDLDPLSLQSNDYLMQNVFNEDQIQILKNQSANRIKWSQETLRKALRLRVACGTSGYQELLHQKIPLPSIQLIEEILNLSPTNPDILNELLKVLKTT